MLGSLNPSTLNPSTLIELPQGVEFRRFVVVQGAAKFRDPGFGLS